MSIKYLHENEVIGAILLDATPSLFACNKVGLEPKHFATGMKRVYEAIQAIMEKPRATVDLITVAEKSGVSFDDLSDMVSKTMSASSCEYHAREIIKTWKSKETLALAMNMVNKLKEEQPCDEVTMEFWNNIQSVQSDNLVQITKVGDHKEGKFEQWRSAKERGYVGVPSSMPSVNGYLGGWRKCLGMIGAYRGTGKSTFIASEGLWQAKQGFRTAIFTLEDPDDMVAAKIVGNHADISTFALDTGHFSEQQLDAMGQAWDNLKDLPLWIVRKAISVPQIISTASMLKQRYGLDICYIDHMQLISPLQLPNMNRNNTLSTYSSQLANMATELDCAVICASQLSRDCEKEGRKPRLSDLRDSGSLEQDCRQCLMLYETTEGFCVDIAKNNYGVSGKTVSVDRVDGRQRFVEIDNGNRSTGGER